MFSVENFSNVDDTSVDLANFDRSRETKQQAIARQLQQLYAVCDSELERLASGINQKYGTAERSTWGILANNARNYIQTRDLSSVPDLAEEAWKSIGGTGDYTTAPQERQAELNTFVYNLAQNVINKSTSLIQQAGSLKGLRTLIETELKQAFANQSVEQIQSFEVITEWYRRKEQVGL